MEPGLLRRQRKSLFFSNFQHLLEAGVLDLYRRHVISRGRAAEILGLTFEDFLRLSNAAGIPYFHWTEDDIEQELLAIDLP